MSKTFYKVLSAILALILIAATVCTIVFWQLGNIQFYSLSETGVDEVDSDVTSEDSDGDLIVEENVESSSGISLLATKLSVEDYEEYGIDTLATTSAYTLTASTSDSGLDITDYELVWSIAFANPDSDWASGKTVTDYCTIAPTTDGGNVAVLTNLQAFGEQIIVTVSSASNSSVNATCTVDYIKGVSAGRITISVSDDEGSIDFINSSSTSNWSYTSSMSFGFGYGSGSIGNGSLSSYSVSIVPSTYSTGTITENYTNKSWSISLNSSAASYFSGVSLGSFTSSDMDSIKSAGEGLTVKDVFEAIFGSSWLSENASKLYTYLQSFYTSSEPVLELSYSMTGATTGNTYSFTYGIIVNFSSLALSSINLDESAVVFY